MQCIWGSIFKGMIRLTDDLMMCCGVRQDNEAGRGAWTSSPKIGVRRRYGASAARHHGPQETIPGSAVNGACSIRAKALRTRFVSGVQRLRGPTPKEPKPQALRFPRLGPSSTILAFVVILHQSLRSWTRIQRVA